MEDREKTLLIPEKELKERMREDELWEYAENVNPINNSITKIYYINFKALQSKIPEKYLGEVEEIIKALCLKSA